jgi:hypothetical protein
MDWLDKYGEVIPTKEDIALIKNYQKDITENDGEAFLNTLISKK